MCFAWLGSVRLWAYAALKKRKHSQPYSRNSHNIRKANYKIPQGSRAVLLFARKKKLFLSFVTVLLPTHPGTSVMLMGAAGEVRAKQGHAHLCSASEMCHEQHLLQASCGNRVGGIYSSSHQISFMAAAWSWVEAGAK